MRTWVACLLTVGSLACTPSDGVPIGDRAVGARGLVGQPGTPWFVEDFAAGNLDRWSPSPLGLFAGWSVFGGAARYDGGGHTQIVAGHAGWTDYVVEARMRLTTPLDYQGGLRGRVDPVTGEAYEIWVDAASQQVKVLRSAAWHVDTPGLDILAVTPVGPIAVGVFHDLSLTFQGSRIVATFDGAVVFDGDDAILTAGGIALDVSGRVVDFDDVTVRPVRTAGADHTPPQISLLAPADGQLLKPRAYASASASDDVGVAGVQFALDGTPLGDEITAPPWALTWNASAVHGGCRVLSATARDAAGNTATDAVEVVIDADGSAAPIVVVTEGARPATRYLSEILTAEGFADHVVRDACLLDGATLAAAEVVVLADTAVDVNQVAQLTAWVETGGKLIAMRPAPALADLLGLAPQGAPVQDGYLAIDTATPPGLGLVGDTLQFHGVADGWVAADAVVVASLYSDAVTPTGAPAVTRRDVGANGGMAAAFTYDLAGSVIATRQGHPAWAGQERDGLPPIRAEDMFYPDWIDWNKAHIPQADIQQRLLANLLWAMTADRAPLPRLWYLPRGERAAIVMTGDDHGNGGTAARFQQYEAASPPGCGVEDWACVRSTSYIYTSTPLSDAQAAAFVADGFEVALHIDSLCANYTPTSLDGFYVQQIAAWSAKYASLPRPATHRIHCGVWSDYDTQARVEQDHGIGLDTNYYTWPGSWVQDRPGYFTGSGLPMRFADATGAVLDVWQATTQMTDESDQSYPFTVDRLLDGALGPDGFTSVLTANMHTDIAASPGSDAIVASAQARGVPIVSAVQMLTWLEGRAAAGVQTTSWAQGTVDFDVIDAPRGLTGLLPAANDAGDLQALWRDGSPVPFSVRSVHGLPSAVFEARSGSYRGTYGP